MTHELLKCAIVACGLSFWISEAQSDTIKGAYIGCLTEEKLDESFTALNGGDQRLLLSLIGTYCVPVDGLDYSLLDRGILTSKIRVYVGADHVDLYVPSEAVSK